MNGAGSQKTRKPPEIARLANTPSTAVQHGETSQNPGQIEFGGAWHQHRSQLAVWNCRAEGHGPYRRASSPALIEVPAIVVHRNTTHKGSPRCQRSPSVWTKRPTPG